MSDEEVPPDIFCAICNGSNTLVVLLSVCYVNWSFFIHCKLCYCKDTFLSHFRYLYKLSILINSIQAFQDHDVWWDGILISLSHLQLQQSRGGQNPHLMSDCTIKISPMLCAPSFHNFFLLEVLRRIWYWFFFNQIYCYPAAQNYLPDAVYIIYNSKYGIFHHEYKIKLDLRRDILRAYSSKPPASFNAKFVLNGLLFSSTIATFLLLPSDHLWKLTVRMRMLKRFN